MEESNTEDFAARYLALEERVRRLAIQAPDDWEWYSLRNYMCAGWIDPMSNSPYRYTDPTAEQQLGYFDTGSSIIFTGIAMWDPQGWWVDPPNPPLAGGNPDVSYDALEFFRPGYNAFQSFVGHGNADAGRSIPYRIPNDELLLLNVPVLHSSDLALALGGAATRMIWGSVNLAAFSLAGVFVPGFGSTGGTNFTFVGGTRYMPEIAPPPVDQAGYTHYSIPQNTVLILQGQTFQYDKEIGRMAV